MCMGFSGAGCSTYNATFYVCTDTLRICIGFRYWHQPTKLYSFAHIGASKSGTLAARSIVEFHIGIVFGTPGGQILPFWLVDESLHTLHSLISFTFFGGGVFALCAQQRKLQVLIIPYQYGRRRYYVRVLCMWWLRYTCQSPCTIKSIWCGWWPVPGGCA